MNDRERTAVEAVAKRFSATWEKSSDPAGACLVVPGKRVGVDIATLKGCVAGSANATKPRLRFDKVVARLMERLQASLAGAVPDGVTVALTITAPIRLASKTAAELEQKIQALLVRGPTGRDERNTLHGNHVRIRLLKGGSQRAPKLMGFVHNSDTDPLLLLDMTREMLDLGVKYGRRPKGFAGDRWLVVRSSGGISLLEAYRHIYSRLRVDTGFQKILMVFGDGRVGELTG